MEGLTLDTGALIALERRSGRMPKVWRAALAARRRITVPTVVVAEWWRNQRGEIGQLLRAVDVEPLTLELAQIAGVALAESGRRRAIDAIVVASAAQRGDVVYTSDVTDLSCIASTSFPGVRVLHV